MDMRESFLHSKETLGDSIRTGTSVKMTFFRLIFVEIGENVV